MRAATTVSASARLTRLETGLRARLFERTTRQLRLTDEGRLYLSCRRQALHALYHRNRFMAPRVRVLLDFLSARFAQVSGELEALLGFPAPARARKTVRQQGI